MYITRRICSKRRGGKIGMMPMLGKEDGSALVIALLILVVLTLVGQIATRTSTTEIQISANDKRHNITFYEADGATELASELLEQNIACPMGFVNQTRGGLLRVENGALAFWQNGDDDATTPSDTNRDFYLPVNYGALPHTNVTVGGHSEFALGSAIQMAAGYVGKGKGSAASGTYLIYDIGTQRVGLNRSESMVWVKWRHMIGTEGTCTP